jgi:hypothetical protein
LAPAGDQFPQPVSAIMRVLARSFGAGLDGPMPPPVRGCDLHQPDLASISRNM